jgi:hypothetical protein
MILLASIYGRSQTSIASWLPGCLPQEPAVKVGISCGGGSSNYGVISGVFTVQNIDGANCCTGPFVGGDGLSYFEFEPINISCFTDVMVSMDYSAAPTTYENNDNNNPIFGCTGNSSPDNTHDQIVFMYSIDGGPFIQSLYVRGTTAADFTGTWNQGGLNGTTLTIRVHASAKAMAEIFRFQNMDVVGTSTLSAGSDQIICFPLDVEMQGICTGVWSGGQGSFISPTDPLTTYVPNSTEEGTTINLTFSNTVAGTSTCPVVNSDVVSVTILEEEDATFTFNNWCDGDPNGPTSVVTPGGMWSFDPLPSDGATINPSTGIISGAVNGTVYGVRHITSGPCPDTLIIFVSQNPRADATFTFADFCVGEPNGPLPVNSGGTFSFNPNPGGTVTINPTTGEISGEVAGATYTVQYTIGGVCPDTYTETVTVLPLVTPTLPVIGPFCDIDPPFSLPTTVSGVSGVWSGSGVSGNAFNPDIGDGIYTLTFTPDPNQCAIVATTSVTVIAGPFGSLVGSPTLCPGQCDDVSFTFTGGSGTYNLTMSVSAGPFNFNFPMIGVTSSTTLQLCLSNNFPPFNVATNTLNIPTFVPPGTYTLTLISITDAAGGPCSIGTVGSGTISFTVGELPTVNDLTLTECDIDGDGFENFDLLANNSNVSAAPNTITWFIDAATTIPITDPSNFVCSNGTTVYALVNSPSGCTSVADVTCQLQVPLMIPSPTFNGCANGPLIPLPPSVGSATGGTWSGPNVTSSGTQFDPTGLPAGTYNIVYNPAPNLCITPVIGIVILGANTPITLNNPFATACVGQGSIILQTSINGVTGTWSGPSVVGNTFNIGSAGTYTITFTPDAGQCFIQNSTTIIVDPTITLTPISFNPICSGSSNISLPGSLDGYNGNWSGPNVSGNEFLGTSAPGTYSIVFTPDNPCVQLLTVQIIVLPVINLVAPPLGPTCLNGTPIPLPSTIMGINGIWTNSIGQITTFNPAVYGVGSHTIVFTPNPNQCADVLNVVINVGQISAGPDRTIKLCLQDIDTIDLQTYLVPGTTPGGIWSYNNSSINAPNVFDISLLPRDTLEFTYLISNPSCGSDTSYVTFITSNPNEAGDDSAKNICQNDASNTNFFSIVNDSMGYWVGPLGSTIDFSNPEMVNISSLGSGTFTFQYILDQGSCPADTSMHQIYVQASNDAGPDDNFSACIGSTIELSGLINTSFTGGIFENPNSITGLTGTSWNTSGQAVGLYTFNYIVSNPQPCKSDTATLRIFLDVSLDAGDAQGNFYCENQILLLETYIKDPSTSKGGQFYLIDGTPVLGNIFDTKSSSGTLTFNYIVGDGLGCPRDTAIYTFTLISEPTFIYNVIPNICETECTTLKLEHSLLPGTILYFSLMASNNQKYSKVVNIVDAQPILLPFCGASNVPYNFGNLKPELNYELLLDSIVIPNKICVFSYGSLGTFNVNPVNTKSIIRTLCRGTTLTVGNDIYSENNPSGTTTINVPPNLGCDTLVTVNLTFIGVSPVTNITRNTCNPAFSVQVGNIIFNRSNPSGQVTLKNIGGCDSIVVVSLTFVPPPVTNINENTCDPTNTFTFGNQTFSMQKPAGTVVIPNGGVLGCDSTLVININYLDKAISEFNFTTCDPSYSIVIGTQKFDKARSTGQVTLSGQSANGCDSIVNVKLDFVEPVINPYYITTCDPLYKITIGNKTFDKLNPQGRIVLTNAASNGCDSIVDVDIQFTSFNVTSNLNYLCEVPLPLLSLNLANQEGPYTIDINGITVAENETLPYDTILPLGTKVIVVSTPEGCRDTITVDVKEGVGPNVSLEQSPLADGFTQITTISPPNTIYNLVWSPANTLSCNTCPNPIASPGPLTTYNLVYNYGNNCADTLYITIEAEKKAIVILPNVISVNGYEQNRIFYVKMPEGVSGVVKKMQIYDRWGNMVFSISDVPANEPSFGWDSRYNNKDVEAGVYVYYIALEVVGRSKIDFYQGDITVFR